MSDAIAEEMDRIDRRLADAFNRDGKGSSIAFDDGFRSALLALGWTVNEIEELMELADEVSP